MRTPKKISFSLTTQFKTKLLTWANQFEEVIWLDSNNYEFSSNEYEAILAVEAFTALKTDYVNAFDKLQEYQHTTKDWIFGYLTYDLKNNVEALSSKNDDGLAFPDLYFFQPKKIFLLKAEEVEMHYLGMVDDEMEEDWQAILNTSVTSKAETENNTSSIESRLTKAEYMERVGKMLSHIHRGDIYEANFCQEFYAEDFPLQPLQTYFDLNSISEPPFAAFLKLEEFHLLSASPERYLKKTGNKVISQPIKGTAKRLEDVSEDEVLKESLKTDPKEISENVMIVDLVRNDLSKTAKKGSVQVEELCKLYSFKQVHQLISTVSSQIKEGISPVEVIKTTFPMGSMTGAPKISAMKIIEELEVTKRGLYSGCVGYFSPQGDFDFNVIIRSILYNSANKYLSFSVGSAITAKSDPEKEYEECLTKAAAMHRVLEKFK
ncbi:MULTISPECIES: aminodeoxychorismate synthase component I [Mesonia]|uniref:Aminodeoxychorismate synthase component 1 n=1 Tax=Mesonia oceanica TaxID=2687242 RepID=A0AC61Y931_9FLAO|nr:MULTISPECIES: aminodeoxychorismate synthase component I [Mesonia]MAN25852.1 aminodeoxychorismate synthase, component I [Mesonia sp.]MAN27528.1 aminodeoxychorismate synthase, component I [Mesonia sp.]MAQ40610.1 aminodeoxychorismate synthase, component I [Mesonia sp.]VVV01007.1 Aminodeoxychorismate synthase component 1 [Mesonia oceanica]|tara:strand:- start:36542 stop:37843 length:1302 start_codon:yes stop_codon:yes gene_type:complete